MHCPNLKLLYCTNPPKSAILAKRISRLAFFIAVEFAGKIRANGNSIKDSLQLNSMFVHDLILSYHNFYTSTRLGKLL
jgi:hypothetical protein